MNSTVKNPNLVPVIELVEQELNRQDQKWGPDRLHTPSDWMVILMEEVGEASREVVEYNSFPDTDENKQIKWARLRAAQKELKECAAVCIQTILSIELQINDDIVKSHDRP